MVNQQHFFRSLNRELCNYCSSRISLVFGIHLAACGGFSVWLKLLLSFSVEFRAASFITQELALIGKIYFISPSKRILKLQPSVRCFCSVGGMKAIEQ